MKLYKLLGFVFLIFMSLSIAYSEIEINPVSLSSSGISTTKQGIEILTGQELITIEGINKSTSSSATIIYIQNSSGADLISAGITGNKATFNYVLSANTTYRIVADNNSGTYTRAFNNGASGYPFDATYFNWTGGVAAAGTILDTFSANIYSIEFTIGNTTPGIITTNLSSIYSTGDFSISIESNNGDNMNFSYSLDGASFIGIENNTNLTTLSLTGQTIGNHNLSIKGVLNGTNYYSNATFEIQPYQYFRVRNEDSGTYLTNYILGGFSSNGTYVTLDGRTLDFGLNTLQFSKTGFSSENFTFSFNNTAQLNTTYNVSATSLSITVFNEFNPAEQLYFNLTLINATDSTIYLNQHNFSINYNQTLTGDLTLIIESAGYLPRNFYTTLSSSSSVSQVLYLLPISDADQVTFRTVSSIDSQPVDGSILNFFRYINGTKVFLGQAETDGNGFTSFNLDSTKIYEVLLTSTGYITQVFNTLPNTLSYTIILNPEGILVDWLFNHFSYKFIPTSATIQSLPQNFSVIYVDDQNLITNAIFTISGDGFSYSTSSTMPSGTTLSLQVNNITSTYTANLQVLRDGETYSFSKIYSYYNESNYNTTIVNLAETLDGDTNTADRVLIMITGFVIFAGIGMWLGGPIAGAMTLFIPLILYGYVGWLPIGLSILLMAFIIMGTLVFGR